MIRLTVPVLERNARLLMAIGAAALLALVLCAAIDTRTTARAVLFAWLYWIGIAAGAMVLLATHALTGGRWGELAKPSWQRASRALFLAAAPFIVIVFIRDLIYPWAPGSSLPAGSEVARYYLNPAGFTVRGAIILGLWSAFGLAAARPVRLRPVAAGLILAIYMPTVTVGAVDWSASLLPQWSSSAYGALVGVSQVTAAIAFAVLLRSGEPSDPGTGDLAGLLLAGILGLAYLGFMQFLVVWSSGLPEKTAWYEIRQAPDWSALVIAAFLLGGLLPFFQLLRSKVRSDAEQSGFAALLVLIGLGFFWAWQVAPGGAMDALWIYPVAFIAVGSMWLGLAFGPFAKQPERAGVGGHV